MGEWRLQSSQKEQPEGLPLRDLQSGGQTTEREEGAAADGEGSELADSANAV